MASIIEDKKWQGVITTPGMNDLENKQSSLKQFGFTDSNVNSSTTSTTSGGVGVPGASSTNEFTVSPGKPSTAGIFVPDGIIGGTDIENAHNVLLNTTYVETIEQKYRTIVSTEDSLPLRQEYETVDSVFLNSPKIDIFKQCDSKEIFASEFGDIIVEQSDFLGNVHKMPNGRFSVLTYTFNTPYRSVTYVYDESTYFYDQTELDSSELNTAHVLHDDNLQIIGLTNVLDNVKVFTYDFYNPIDNTYTAQKYLGPIIQNSGNKKYGNNIPYYDNIISEEVNVHSYDYVTYISLVASYDDSLYTLIDDFSNNTKKVVRFYKAVDDYKKTYEGLQDNNAFILSYDLNSLTYFSYGFTDDNLIITRYTPKTDDQENYESTKVVEISLTDDSLQSLKTMQVSNDIFYYVCDNFEHSLNPENETIDEPGETNIWFNFSYDYQDSNFNTLTKYTLDKKVKQYNEILNDDIDKDCTHINIIIADSKYNNDILQLRFNLNEIKSNPGTTYLYSKTVELYNSYVIDYGNDYSNDFNFYDYDIEVADRQYPILQTYVDTRNKFQNDVPSYSFKTQELKESINITSTYLYFNSLTGDYEPFIPNDTNKIIIYSEGSFYGVISDNFITNFGGDKFTYEYTDENEQTHTYADCSLFSNIQYNAKFNIVPVTKRITFDSGNEDFRNKFIPNYNQQVNITNYVPFYLKNAVDKVPQNEFILNTHKYSYILKQNYIYVEDENGTYIKDNDTYIIAPSENTDTRYKKVSTTINVIPTIIQDEYWSQEYKEVEKPLIVTSETTLTHSLDVERAQIVAGLQDVHMGTIHHPKVTYNDFEITYTKETKYGYYDSFNVFKVFDGKTYDIDGEIIGIFRTKDDAGNDKDEPVILSKFTSVSRDRVLKEFVYQEDSYEDIISKRESSFKFVNGEKLILDEEIYHAPEYEDVVSVNPITYEYEVIRNKVSDEYITYAYHYETIPLITNSYVYQQNAIEIANLDNIASSINNNADSIVSIGNNLDEALRNINLNIETGVSNINNSIQSINLSSTIASQEDKNRVLFSEVFNGLINRYEQSVSSASNKIDSSIDTLSAVLSKVGETILDANEEILKKQIEADETNNSNLINSVKKQLGNINDSIKTLSNAITSSQSSLSSSLSNVLTELSKQDDTPTTMVYIDAGDGSYTSPINFNTTSSGTTGEIIKNFASIKQIGYVGPVIVEVTKQLAPPANGEKVGKTKKVNEIQQRPQLLDKFTETETTYFNAYNSTIHALTAQMGLHKTVNTTRVINDNKIYEVDNITYEGIADILYAMSRRIPTKQEFVIDVAQKLYVNTSFDIETSYKSPSDHAKMAIRRAMILWDELENTKFVKKPAQQDNTLAYSLISKYNH